MESALNPGDILNARYCILTQLGQGGFGRTYLAEDISRFNEKCVLKEFAPRCQSPHVLAKAQELFEREAEVLYRLKNVHIPKFRALFRADHQDTSRLFLIQDYVEGKTYHSIFQDRYQKGIGFSQEEIQQLLFQLLPVLEYIHSLGVIHRDISPENIMLRNSDRMAMLIDFGSIKDAANKAQYLIEGAPKQSLSFRGTILGKSGYAPPEQIVSGVIYYHSDLYALAATSIVLLAGKDPRELIDAHSFQWHLQGEVNLDRQLGWALNKMLSPNPNDRFPTARQAMQALQITSKVPVDIPLREELSSIDQIRSFRHSSTKIWLYLSLITIAWVVALPLWLENTHKPVVPMATVDSPDTEKIDSQLPQRFSQGERILISQVMTPEKQLAVAEFAAANYSKAKSLLEKSLLNYANDPESLIYLNNADIGDREAHTIAVSIPLGSNLNATQEILRGVAQAQNQINQEGRINGIPLKVLIVNDDDNPDIAKQVATKLSENPQILGLVGHYASDVTLATAKIYESGQLTVISPISTSVKLSNFSPYVFRTVPSDYIAARALAEYMLEELDKKNVAIFYSSQSNYSQSLKSEFATAVSLGGGRIVHEFDLSSPNFSAAQSLKQAIDGETEVLMLAANTATLDKALQVVQVNRKKLDLLAGDGVYAPKTLEVVGELAENMVIAIPWHIKKNLDVEFVKTANQLWRGEVNWRTAMAYDATQALIAAIEQNPTRVGVQKVLSNANFSAVGASSTIHFSPSGDRLEGIQLVEVCKSDRLSFGYEFVPISDSP
ncbi:MAG: bifunctional serine/threonine-protein kinase/ABC transporter substrate-binding protein [Xenococcaceae cyanobacterium MO_188.B32]|nr:bifunctional serine/threonine-protein kinase/ABC transporter substrate-binding protein [Xenococcaceae cyanobacterium MO_188.B32]